MKIEPNIVQNDGGKLRNKALDCYKGILIMLVVLGHVLEYSVSDWNHNIIQNFIWAVQMPGFMLVSGYFSFKKVENIDKLRKEYKKNTERYLLPFLSWFLFISVLLLGGHGHNVIKGLNSLLWRVDNGLWFIWIVFILSLVFGMCNWVREKIKGYGKQFLAIAMTVGVTYGFFVVIALYTSVNFMGIKFILYYGLFYGFGWFVKWTESFWQKKDRYFYDMLAFVCICVFAAIIYNVNLYLVEDNLLGIFIRLIAGFTGNFVIYYVVKKIILQLQRVRMNWIGMYTLEIYVTHMYMNHFFSNVSNDTFFTVPGFLTFVSSLVCTVIFTGMVIIIFKSIPATNYLFYGKRK